MVCGVDKGATCPPQLCTGSMGSSPGAAPTPLSWGSAPPPQQCPQDPTRGAASPGPPPAQLGPGSPGQDCGWERRISDPASGALPPCLQPLPGGKELHPAPPAPPAPLPGWTQSRQHRPLGAPSKQYWDELAEYTAGSATISARSGLAPPSRWPGPPGGPRQCWLRHPPCPVLPWRHG